jgi:hypothetical protein
VVSKGEKAMTQSEQIQMLEERIQQLEEIVCLAKVRCKKCGSTLIILPTTKYVACKCGELFGDAFAVLGGAFDEINALEWISEEGYENQLLMSHLRTEVSRKYPRLLPHRASS